MTIALQVWILGALLAFGAMAASAIRSKDNDHWVILALLFAILWPLIGLVLLITWIVEVAEYLIRLHRIRRGRR